MTTSFNTALDNLKAMLETNPGLMALSEAYWSKPITIKRVFKHRTEISASELPIILITAPSVSKSFLIGARDGDHTLRLYCGFLQDDREKAQEQITDYEEAIDDALLSVEPSSLGLRQITPGSSANDEGMFHPVYFMVMEVTVQHRR